MPDLNKENVINSLEKIKEVLKIYFDYHKHMTTLSAGAILIIIAIIEGIFKKPEGIGVILSSIICFVLSLICSLIVMILITHVIMRFTEGSVAYVMGEEDELEKCVDKINKISNRGNIFDILYAIFFILGIALLVIFAFINFL